MGPYGVGKLLDAHTGDDFVVSRDFQELLVEDVVLVAIDEVGDITYYGQDVKFIPFDGVIGQEDIVEL